MTAPFFFQYNGTELFQLTSSRRGWPDGMLIGGSGSIFQLTSSRRGWRECTFPYSILEQISTHILTKRMTVRVVISLFVFHISTHILTKRMTLSLYKTLDWNIHFNSHPHEEDDNCNLRLCFCSFYFNSHPHEEDDHMEHFLIETMRLFQLTSSRRGWQRKIHVFQRGFYFNSHPHEEDDISFIFKNSTVLHFNSHPHEEDDYHQSVQ